MALKDNYGLPDSTLQLIGSAPDLNFGAASNNPGLTSIISALRGERSSNNPGVRLLANRANGAGLTFNRKPAAGTNRFPILTNAKVTRPDVTLPTGETGTPYVRPDTPVAPDVPYRPIDLDTPLDPDPPIDPDTPVDPDPFVDPDIEDLPDPDPYVDDPDIEDLPDPDPYVDPDIEDLPDPDPYDPSPDIIEDLPDPDPYSDAPVDVSEWETKPDLTDGSYWDSPDSPDPVGPNRGGGDLDESFDSYLVDSLFGGGGSGGGGGKYMEDFDTAAYATGGKVTPDRLAGPNPAGPDDGFATLKSGEFVLNKDAAKAIGYELLNRLNRVRP